jgi:hypothetical protein
MMLHRRTCGQVKKMKSVTVIDTNSKMVELLYLDTWQWQLEVEFQYLTFKTPLFLLPYVSFIQNLCQNCIQFFSFVLGII